MIAARRLLVSAFLLAAAALLQGCGESGGDFLAAGGERSPPSTEPPAAAASCRRSEGVAQSVVRTTCDDKKARAMQPPQEVVLAFLRRGGDLLEATVRYGDNSTFQTASPSAVRNFVNETTGEQKPNWWILALDRRSGGELSSSVSALLVDVSGTTALQFAQDPTKFPKCSYENETSTGVDYADTYVMVLQNDIEVPCPAE